MNYLRIISMSTTKDCSPRAAEDLVKYLNRLLSFSSLWRAKERKKECHSVTALKINL